MRVSKNFASRRLLDRARSLTGRALRSYSGCLVKIPTLCLRAFFIYLCLCVWPGTIQAARVSTWSSKVDSAVLRAGSDAPASEIDFIVVLAEQADLSGAAKLASKVEKAKFVYERLTSVAERSQPAVTRALAKQGLAYQPFWAANMIRVRGPLSAVQMMAQRSDVARIHANPQVHFQEPVDERKSSRTKNEAIDSIEPNISHIHAPDVWALGYTGQGIVVGGTDTGYLWNHAALIGQYRGWDGSAVDHNFNWHDAIHSNGGPCGPNSAQPCDDYGHGTHTMGTMIGTDGASNQIGVAPGAKWIGCRCMDQGVGTPTTYTECLQWFIAPTDSNGENADPAKAPDVINNSWTCTDSEGCTDVNVLKTIIENVRASGIVVVAAAGNDGSACSTVQDPPAIYDASTSVGAVNNLDTIASFSSRGPVSSDGSNRLKPDVSAPGVSVRSAWNSSTSTYVLSSGTSMAAPHVVGTTALILSAHPELRGNVDAIETLLEQSAVGLTNGENCGGLPSTQIPNNTFGWGRIDALAAVGLDDDDGDGMANWKEILAGTDRENASSSLHCTDFARNGAQDTITFSSVPGKHYRLERSSSLTSPDWTTVEDNVMATNSIASAFDTTSAAETPGFYRIVLVP